MFEGNSGLCAENSEWFIAEVLKIEMNFQCEFIDIVLKQSVTLVLK